MKFLTFSTALDSGYLALWPVTPAEYERISPVFRFVLKQAETSHTSFVTTVNPEVGSTTQ